MHLITCHRKHHWLSLQTADAPDSFTGSTENINSLPSQARFARLLGSLGDLDCVTQLLYKTYNFYTITGNIYSGHRL